MVSSLMRKSRTIGSEPPATGGRFGAIGDFALPPDPYSFQTQRCTARIPFDRADMEAMDNVNNKVERSLEAEAEAERVDRMEAEVKDALEVRRGSETEVRAIH
jgi:hypothetical protein